MKNSFNYFFAKMMVRFKHSNEPINDYYRKCGISIGRNCLICTNIWSDQGFLISIGDNTTIASNVTILTHDYSIHNVMGKSTLYGKVNIGNNCFIGARSIILPGVSIANNTIVAAGSVVTKSVLQSNTIIGGNPAHQIGDWETYKKKYENNGICFDGSKSDLIRKLSEFEDKLISK